MKKSKLKFVNLHGHSGFSMFDGYGFPELHMDFAYSNGCDALALTDHGHMNALSYQILHTKKMKADGKNFKSIYGVEAYFIPSLDDWREQLKEYREENAKKKKKKKKKDEAPEVGDDARSDDKEALKKKYKGLKHRRHIVLLAKNQIGLNNIFKAVSLSHMGDNYYYYPRIDYEILREHNEGVIATSACLGGVYAGDYWMHKDEGDSAVLQAMCETTEEMLGIFGEERWLAEVQWNGIPEQHELNKFVIEVADIYGLNLISTADAHYPTPESWQSRELYKKLDPKWKDRLSEELPTSTEELGYELYPKNGDEIWESYKKYSSELCLEYDDDLIRESIEFTHHIAHNEIEDFIPDNTIRLPRFVVPAGKTAKEVFIQKVKEGIRFRDLPTTSEILNRLKTEVDTIISKDFCEYFLTMKYVVDEARKLMICGPGRGSGAGSLVAYVLGITDINPLKYDLLFERFLRKDSKDYPDIDFDVAERAHLVDHLIEELGETSVIPISNWNKLKLRSLIKIVSKYFYGKEIFQEINAVTTVMMTEATPRIMKERDQKAGILDPPASLEEVKRNSASLQDFLRKYPDIEKWIDELYGQVNALGRHAGGVVIGDNLDYYMPLIRGKLSEADKKARRELGKADYIMQTPWSEGQYVRHLEPLGYIKFDLLGITTLSMINRCLELVLRRRHGIKKPTFEQVRAFYDENLHPDIIDFDNRDIYRNIFWSGRWVGIFQFTEDGAQSFCQKVKPKNLIELATITSIYRPGPLSANVHSDYVKARNKGVKYDHPIIEEVTSETYGFLVFQEQIALLAHKMGDGINLDEANLLRKVLTKKGTGKAAKVKEELKKKFLDGCKKKGFGLTKGMELWEKFVFFNSYGFNKSHAVSYSAVSFQCAWLLHNYPVEWCAAFLEKEPEKRKEKALSIVKGMGFKIKKADILYSGLQWEPLDDETIIQPMVSIKGVGEKAVNELLLHKPYSKIEDILFGDVRARVVNKRVISAMIKSGCMESLIDERFRHMRHFWLAVADDKPKTQKKLDANIEKYKNEADFTDNEKLTFINELTGRYPIDRIVSESTMEKLERANVPTIGDYYHTDDEDEVHCIADPKEDNLLWGVLKSVTFKKTKKNKEFALLTLVDKHSVTIEAACWSYSKSDFILHRPYMAALKHGNWGWQCANFRRSFKILG